MIQESQVFLKTKPLCPIFGECGGCQYQDIPYQEELRIKEKALRELFWENVKIEEGLFDFIVPSPQEYHYRNRIDLRLVKTKSGEIFIGFTPESRPQVIPIEACSIALPAISSAIPSIKKQIQETLPARYRNANVVVRTGEEGFVRWGGIGRRSLTLNTQDYFSTAIGGKKIYYSLDTFFQANLSILPCVIERIKGLPIFGNEESTFLDLYGGVGFFGICLADKVKEVILIEESIHSLKLAHYNVKETRSANVKVIEGKVEDQLSTCLRTVTSDNKIAMIDPPRGGLSDEACGLLSSAKELNHLLYLSCHPETLVRDLKVFLAQGWEVTKIIPFDFFPRTKHIETLVLLKPKR